MKYTIATLTLLTVCVAATLGASTIQLSLALEPSSTLPGVPVTLRLQAINNGSTPGALPVLVRLETATSAGWKPICFAQWEHHGCATTLPLPPDDTLASTLALAPGEQQSLNYVAGPGSPPWLDHPDLLTPGTFALRLVTWDESGSLDPIISNQVTLTVQAPTGVDASAWQLISSATHVNAERSQYADQLWSLYPGSIYTAMTPRRVHDQDDWAAHLAAFTEALAKNPPAGYADAYNLGIATAHTHLMDDAMDEFNVQRAFQHSEAARVVLAELLGKDAEISLKADAAKLMQQNVLSLTEIEEVVNRLRVRNPGPTCEQQQISIVRTQLDTLLAGAGTQQARTALKDIIGDLEKFARHAQETPPAMHAALAGLEQAAQRLATAIARGWVARDAGTKALQGIGDAAKLAASKAISAAAGSLVVKESDLALARRRFDEGVAAMDAGDVPKALTRFREALHKAEQASDARGAFC